ncbi:MAG: hypothetical protein AAB642_01160 [Patescibacteria group bacterium]
MHFTKPKNLRPKTGAMMLAVLLLLAPQAASAGWLDNAVTNWLTDSALGTVLEILHLFVSFVGYILITLAASVVNFAFNFQQFLEVPVVQIGWTLTRDIANMAFILLMLVMAFGTILRMESYGWKKMLPKLVVMALLINFSLIISGVVLDVANSLAYFFVSAGGTATDAGREVSVGDNIMTALQMGAVAQIQNDVNLGTASNAARGMITKVIMVVFIQLILYLIVAFLLFAMGLMMIYRLIRIWISLIMAPFYWVSYAIPGYNRFNQWWMDFLKQAFFPAIMGFFIFLGMLTAATLNSVDFLTAAKDVGGFWGTIISTIPISMIMQYIVVVSILFYGLTISQSWGASGAKMMLDVANKSKGWALGKTKTGLKKAAKAVPGTALRVADKYTGGAASRGLAAGLEKLEKAPLIGRAIGGAGARFARQQKDLKETAGKFSGLRPSDIEARIKQAALTPEGLKERAGMIKALIEKGEFSLDQKDEFKDTWLKHLQTYQAQGGNLVDLLKKRPDLATNADIQTMISRDVNASPNVKAKWNGVATETNTDEKENKITRILNEDVIKTAADFAGIQKEAVDMKGKLDPADNTAFEALERDKKALQEIQEDFLKTNDDLIKKLGAQIGEAQKAGQDYSNLARDMANAERDRKTTMENYIRDTQNLTGKQAQISGRGGQRMFMDFVTNQLKKDGFLYGGSLNSLASKNKGAHIEMLKYLKPLAPGLKDELKEDVYKHITAGLVANTMIEPTAAPTP